MNALELLKADHKKVAGLFEQFKADEDGDHSELFEKIKAELDVHAHIEENIFYPRMKAEGDEELQKIVDEGIEEHRQMKMFLKQISELADGSEKMNAKLKVLIEDTEHHVMEEEGEMFSLIEEQFEPEALEELGAELEAEKKKFKPRSASA
jgi:hemerythrin-like domain-containing protein